MTNKFFEIHPDGKLVRVTMTREDVGPTMQLAASLAATSVFKFRDKGWPGGLVAGVGRDNYHIAVRLPRLVFDTAWAPAQDAGEPVFLTPLWVMDFDSVRARFEWTPPEGLAVWLFVAVHADSNPRLRLGFAHNGKLKVAPLPNIFPDGRVCTGDAISTWSDSVKYGSVPDIAAWAVQLLESAPWNVDLLSAEKTLITRDLIRVDPANPNTPVPFTGDISRLLSRVEDLAGVNTDWIGGGL